MVTEWKGKIIEGFLGEGKEGRESRFIDTDNCNL
jgi:hypothetical protein